MSRYPPAGLHGMIAEGLGKVPNTAMEDALSGLCALLNANISLAVLYALVRLS